MDKNTNHITEALFATRRDIVLCVILGCVNLLLFGIMCEFTEISVALIALGVIALYVLEATIIGIRRRESHTHAPVAALDALLDEDLAVVIRNTDSPAFIFDSYGTILWYNEAMHSILDKRGNFLGENISRLIEKPISVESMTEEPITLFGGLYMLEGFNISSGGDGFYLAILTDVTELHTVRSAYVDERVCVAYVTIDNIEDITTYAHEKYRDAVSAVEDKIKAWVKSMGGVIKSYDNEKYLCIFDAKSLDECIKGRFPILDEIRDTRVGDGVSVTVSIGVSKVGKTLLEREMNAISAIDLALGRGGDQAVYKTDEGIEFFGGRTKSLYKRSSVRSRTFTNQLNALMARSDNVIIMGHKFGDFDSFGASVGVARLATLCGVGAKIAVDMRDKNIAPCIEYMQSQESYSGVFVDAGEANHLLKPDTLVVLVDHNTLERAQFADIARRASQVAILDHHRKSEALSPTVKLSYIEPSASSTCELVAEMLDGAISSQSLYKCEADMILAGILLDTKQFTRNTGTRTFGAAQYLIGAGANPTDVYNLFKTLPDDLSKEARFHTSITVYKERIAISSCDGNTDESFRVIASKAADKMLTLRGIDAAFTVVRIGDMIHISGRSNGKINVQIILEHMGGGGHFEIAGAQIESDSVLSVLETLKGEIDEYLDLLGEKEGR
ncbi:MAG: DHH family phosphoesterase [Clostridia bacterium]|nr:DHH family phosphoesterase [Clostridia bacterium]